MVDKEKLEQLSYKFKAKKKFNRDCLTLLKETNSFWRLLIIGTQR